MHPSSILAAYEKARDDLLAERIPAGHWIGELASSALATATAISAMSLMRKHRASADGGPSDVELGRLIAAGIARLASQANDDGGFGDTDLSRSNIATTMLVVAAMHLAGVEKEHAELLTAANRYIDSLGRIEGLRKRYGEDKTFAVPILTNCALAGLVSWCEVDALPFELAALPQSFFRFMQLPVVSYAIPALVAIGQAKYFHDPPWNPIMRVIRWATVGTSLEVLRIMQPASGGYLEAVPLTSFVTMSLAATGRADHAVAREGLKFIVASARADGSWPIDTNLACWNTTLAMNALSAAGEPLAALGALDWVLACQHRETHPFTGAATGGWGWSDLSGAVPDADDTPSALLALAAILREGKVDSSGESSHHAPPDESATRSVTSTLPRIENAAAMGITWLLDLQNSDGGWPTFCRGWTRQVFDRSGSDLTAHAIRALHAWRDRLPKRVVERIDLATTTGFTYLSEQQKSDGSWLPLWFGNQDHPLEDNPVYGTAKVLLAFRDLDRIDDPAARKGLAWLVRNQNPDGGWGGGPGVKNSTHHAPREEIVTRSVTDTFPETSSLQPGSIVSSVEETSLAVEALIPAADEPQIGSSLTRGLDWLVAAVAENRHRQVSPIGFYFAKLWYYERLYPQTFAVSALGHAVARFATVTPRNPSRHP